MHVAVKVWLGEKKHSQGYFQNIVLDRQQTLRFPHVFRRVYKIAESYYQLRYVRPSVRMQQLGFQ
jgi:hypothetical protein